MGKANSSIQLHLHDFFAVLGADGESAAASSWGEARLKLQHTAFIELNERAVLEVVYGGQQDFTTRRWKGHRLIGIDSCLDLARARKWMSKLSAKAKLRPGLPLTGVGASPAVDRRREGLPFSGSTRATVAPDFSCP